MAKANTVNLTKESDVLGISDFSPVSSHRISVHGVEYGVQNGNESWSLANPDSQTLRFEVRSGDQWRHDDNLKERSEVSSDTLMPYGETVNVSYSFMIEPGQDNQATGAVGTGNWLTIGQFHSDDGGSSSTFAVEMIGEKMAIRAAYKQPGKDYVAWYEFKDSADIVRGKYYEMDIQVKFANDQSGFLNVWRDGVQIVDYDGPMGYGAGVYWKYGIYRREQDEKFAINYRDMDVTKGDKGILVADGGNDLPSDPDQPETPSEPANTEQQEGVVIVGTSKADEISDSVTPDGQPTVTDFGDVIVGSGGSDVALAGDGDDTLVMGNGDDEVVGSKGDDVLKGGAGDDEIKGGLGEDVIIGGNGSDVAVGGAGDDRVAMGDGDDRVVGSRGDDVLRGGTGNDKIKGGKGSDTLFGGGGNDKLIGGNGDDRLDGGSGKDILIGGRGNDVFAFAPGFGDVKIRDFKPGRDMIEFDDLFSNFGAVKDAMSKVKGGTLIEHGDDSIFLAGVKAYKLDADDFLFV